jgi:hypothetical protein
VPLLTPAAASTVCSATGAVPSAVPKSVTLAAREYFKKQHPHLSKPATPHLKCCAVVHTKLELLKTPCDDHILCWQQQE